MSLSPGADSDAGRGPDSARRLNGLLSDAGLDPLEECVASQFAEYLRLILHWNKRVNLTAIRDEEGVLRRHFVECIACAQALSSEIRTLLDYGSGAGFPGIPIALCRRDIDVTLAESQGKKAAFLREAVRQLGVGVGIHHGRAEELPSKFDCVSLRAVDRMEEAVSSASRLVRAGGYLAVMTTEIDVEAIRSLAGVNYIWLPLKRLPWSTVRVLAIAQQHCRG